MSKFLKFLNIIICIYILYFLFENYNNNIKELINFDFILFIPLMALGLVVVLLNTLRFMMLLHSQNIKLTYYNCLKINMCSSVFDIILPSSNGGDLARIGYLVKNKNHSKMAGTFSVFYDRALGFFSIFIILLLSLMITDLIDNKEIVLLKNVIIITVILSAVFFWVIGSRRLLKKIINFPILHKIRLVSLLDTISQIRNNFMILANTLFLSFVTQCINMTSIFIIFLYFDYHEINIVNFLISSSIGLISNIFGFAGGFGTGTLAFHYCYSKYLFIENSLQIVLIYQFSQILLRTLGIPFFIYSKNDS